MAQAKYIPSEYRQVEYIQTEPLGGQYIRTGIISADSAKITLSTYVPSDTIVRFVLTTYQEDYYTKGFAQYDGRACATNCPLNSVKRVYSFDFNSNGINNIIANGIYYGNSYYRIENDGEKTLLGSGTNRRYMLSTTLYNAVFYNNGVIVAYLLPCIRLADGVAGLYDTKRKKFFTNAGSGNFITPDT